MVVRVSYCRWYVSCESLMFLVCVYSGTNHTARPPVSMHGCIGPRSEVMKAGEVVVDASLRRAFGGHGCAARGRAVRVGELLCEAAVYAPQLHGWSLVANELSMLLLLRAEA